MTDRPEQRLHIAVVHFLRLAAPELVVFHPLQGGFAADARQMARFKAQGFVAGVPDLAFVLPGGVLGLIELKAVKGRLSEAQVEFMRRAKAAGALVEICRSLDEVAVTLSGWGVTLRGQVAA